MMFLTYLLIAGSLAGQSWVGQASGTTASLRGVSAVNDRTVWAGGSGGTWLRTVDGGSTWQAATVPGASELDFRGVQGIDANTAYLLSSGPGDRSLIYKTTDAGATWELLFTNPDAHGFFDAITFRDADHGIVAGDPVNGEIAVFTTADGGKNWERQHTPPALPNEGGFAASNSSLTMRGNDVWFGTGGTGAARIFHSADGGATWTVATTPLRNDANSAGIFSISFADALHGIAVGGDYAKDAEARQNIAATADGGRTWGVSGTASGNIPAGFRSAVIWLPGRKVWLVTGTSGSDISSDNGKSWRTFDTGSYNALGGTSGSVWAVGAKGRIATIKFSP
jgi:photosystem II stability/assembly factor-like uncharacterized protein